MTIMIDPGYALRFNGITDGVLIPASQYTLHGTDTQNDKQLPNALRSFTLETWVIPDTGGSVFEYENIMRLSIGTPTSPSPAQFEVNLKNIASGVVESHILTSAKPVYDTEGNFSYWDGLLFPYSPLDLHNTNIATDATKNDVTALNDGHRELLNVTVLFNHKNIALYVNGDIVASKQFDEDHELVLTPSRMFLGGRGGEYRGIIEAIHFSRGRKESGKVDFAPVKNDDTIGLWRFEEPIEPISLITVTPSISASTAASSSINIGATAAQALIDELGGQSGLTAINFTTTSPWKDMGEYSVNVHTATSFATRTIPKVPYNILVNPLGYSSTTGKATNKAPERLRLMAIDGSAGTITVESIHLDFASNATNGRRGALQAHDAGRFVVITGDCIVDGGNGNEYQPQGSGTQFSHRQGQVVIDESRFGNNGLMFSMTMATRDVSENKFSAYTVNPGDGFLMGHSGRHTLNHVTGHPFMGLLPPISDYVIDKKIDSTADVVSATFESQYSNIKDTVPVNSVISAFNSHNVEGVRFVSNSSIITRICENGMSDIADSQRAILAIGGKGFDATPFALRAQTGTDILQSSDKSKQHLIPSSESRIALVEVPSLETYDYAPFVQVHYNAIDYTGSRFGTCATSRVVGTSSSTVVTVQSIKSFGKDGETFAANEIFIGNTPASTVHKAANTVTLHYGTKQLRFSAATDSAFQSADVTNAIVSRAMTGGSLMVSKVVPDVTTVVTGSTTILDLMRSDMATAPLNIYSPGGIIEFDIPDMFPFKAGQLEGDSSEGNNAEDDIDISLTPSQYLPMHSSDSPQTTPRLISSAKGELGVRNSSFSKIIVRRNTNSDSAWVDTGDASHLFTGNAAHNTGVLINNSGGYSASTTGAMTVDGNNATHYFESGEKVYRSDGTLLGTITAIGSTSITIGAGTAALVLDNEPLFNQPVGLLRGTDNHSSGTHEVFDIIEHTSNDRVVQLIVQPNNRARFSQLANWEVTHSPLSISIEHLMSRGRVLSFSDDNYGNSTLRAHGLISDISSASVNVKGDAAPDSHIVKEIMPGAPVVAVTLGGPGQGAINTKETWQPSPTAHLGWNTRRDCTVLISGSSISTIVVKPLNNRAEDLASWGTYCFPKVGRVYVAMRDSTTGFIRYASAEYASKTGTTFTFVTGSSLGTGKFLDFSGNELNTFSIWYSHVHAETGNGSLVGLELHVDDKFSEESMCSDGTTINDRLFQTLDTVSHDYQLGSQYASTRALVEIPLFEKFFFEDASKGIFPGPDNSMKIHIDCTHTAHSWAPNPVGRRFDAVSPQDPEVFAAFSYTVANNTHQSGTKVTQPYDVSNHRVHVEDSAIFPISSASPIAVAGINGSARYRRAFLNTGEWCIYTAKNQSSTVSLELAGAANDGWSCSKNFVRDLKVGALLTPAPGYQDMNYESIADNPHLISAGYEGRRSFYYDRSNVMTQGGNIDYGLRQYVSAVEFRAGPSTNPHLDKIKSKRARSKVISTTSGGGGIVATMTLEDASDFPLDTPNALYGYRLTWRNASGTLRYGTYVTRTNNVITVVSTETEHPAAGDEVYIESLYALSASTWPRTIDGFLSRAWAHPYAPGGLRDGDTVWMNMHYTNPHAMQGLFCKSRGTLDEGKVWTEFTGGMGSFHATSPRDSIPMENFLIGNTCMETAQNFVQHVNKTIELNHTVMGLPSPADKSPLIAYIDPYQNDEGFARVLLYDVAHDREFIAFQDLWMQVQSSADATKIGAAPSHTGGVILNTDANTGSWLDVPAGFPSQSPYLNSTTQSDFIETSYVHNSTWNASTVSNLANHIPQIQTSSFGVYAPRTNQAVVDSAAAAAKHDEILEDVREQATFFDTPDGTRCIPAFLALKGIRANALDLTNHKENHASHGRGINNHPYWTQMDFTRRLSIDFGEVALKDGVTDIEAAAREVVRMINQAGAKNGRTHALSNELGVTASTHDPAPFWDPEKSFASHDRGTHMGYVRAHLGRVVKDSNDSQDAGFSIVIHSTVPGASGRNFCTWLDNSKAQSPYQPKYLIGHGGRFRNYWCQPDEVTGENMHPAPMPINRYGRPFAPITTLREFLPPEEANDRMMNNLDFGPETQTLAMFESVNQESTTGRNYNSVANESFETKSPASTLINGLRVGTKAKARINFGGMTQAGIPGWAPDTGKWGFGRDGENPRFDAIYGVGVNGATIKATSLNNDNSGHKYIPSDDMQSKNIGDGNLYGVQFVDHRGDSHTIRMVYRQYGEKFANDLTTLPPSIDEEVMVYFDDRDVAQGGFTVGNHMAGTGEATGHMTNGTASSWKGNLWNNYPARDVGIRATTAIAGSGSARTLTLTLQDPYQSGGNFSHTDVLGYLGFPKKNGMIQLSDDGGHIGLTFYYSTRTTGGVGSTVAFKGVTGGYSGYADGADWIISPRINFTSVLTDEVIAAAVEYAMKLDNSTSDDIGATSFDCTSMFAPDGRTLAEWGVSPTAIRVKTKTDGSVPLSKLFEVSRGKDWGLVEGASSDAVVGSHHTGGLSNAERDAGTRLDVGYIPETVLHIKTKYRGSNANTATPVLVDNQNNAIDTGLWQRNLRGDNYTDVAGDHIIPRVDSPTLKIDSDTSTTLVVASNDYVFLAGAPTTTAGTGRWGERYTLWFGSEEYGSVAGTDEDTLTFAANDGTSSGFTNSAIDQHDILIKNGGPVHKAKQIDGIRRAGSKKSSPFLYFRGGRDSADHWVPLYFGGGFSGVVMDINDGTENDYSDFYTHPYSAGPTGAAGLQNAGELGGSFALLDTNAMLAMFPGTPYLDQHKGMNNPPFFNQDAILPFDMAKGGSSKFTGVDYTDGTNTVHANIPSPIVIRFAHPHQRYTPDSAVVGQTTYMIFGPGQAFPHNYMAQEPQGSAMITAGNGYSSVPIHKAGGDVTKDTFLPNQLANGQAHHSGFNAGTSGTEAEEHLPMSTFYQKNNVSGFNYVMNWEPTKGFPNYRSSSVLTSSSVLINQPSGTPGYPKGYFGPMDTDTADPVAFMLGQSVYDSAGNDYGTISAIGVGIPGSITIEGTGPTNPGILRDIADNTVLYYSVGYAETYQNAHYYDGTIVSAAAHNLPIQTHPFNEGMNKYINGSTRYEAGNSNWSTTRLPSVLWHMDGGYHPGGHFLDNCVRKNPINVVSGGIVSGNTTNQHNPVSFRPAGLLATAFNAAFGTPHEEQVSDMDMVIVDATRVQNAEELGTVLSAAINTFPGTSGTLKAIGGTFMPSMQNAHSQDRYGWHKLIINDSSGYTAHSGTTAATLVANTTIPTTIPQYGWIRMSTGVKSAVASYSSYTGSTFTLGTNSVLGVSTTNAYEPNTGAPITAGDFNVANVEIYVWTKAGVRRHNNVAGTTARDHLCHVHFSGLHDAVDRTKPIGAVGWHGEAYSYLNSYNTGSGYPAGLGAWHPFLGFTPYGAAETCLGASSPMVSGDVPATNAQDYCVAGLSARHLVAVSHEGALPILAFSNREEIVMAGDRIAAYSGANWTHSGTTPVTTGAFNKSRYIGSATGGPHVEAHVHTGFTRPTERTDYPLTGIVPSDAQLHRTFQSGDMVQATTCLYPTGDLFWDESVVKSSNFHENFHNYGVECMGLTSRYDYLDIARENNPSSQPLASQPHYGIYGYYAKRSAARNFLPEHIVWKRMDGGNLTMPALNARGLGQTPWVTMKDSSNWKQDGEKILGNVRFSFETTNASMFPIIQAQELSHPQLAEQYSYKIQHALLIPNEEEQFKSLQVIDDTGQEHRIEGGSPLGTVIMDFRHVNDREIQGLAPALAGSGVSPNMKIRLPNPDEIPGNIIVRSGFDRIQGYQNETMGSGGLQHPSQPNQQIIDLFSNTNAGPRLWPFWENNGWEHISQDGIDISTVKNIHRLSSPASTSNGWEDSTGNAPLQTAYEPHDRSLYFHVTRMGISSTHRYSPDELNYTSYSGSVITVGSAPEAATWKDTTEKSGGRWFLRVYDPTTNKGVIASYTNTSGSTFTGVVYSPDFAAFVEGKAGLKVVPSYYVPAGTTRFFASRRLRDHSEISGASPDMKQIDWFAVYGDLPDDTPELQQNPAPFTAKLGTYKMTPMPIPRMGHHYVTPTMALLPGHYAHPAYQRLYDLHHACRSSNHTPIIDELLGTKAASRAGNVASGVLIHNGSGYVAGTTGAMVVDTADPTAHFAIGDGVYTAVGDLLGFVTAVDGSAPYGITIGGGISESVVDNQPLHKSTATTLTQGMGKDPNAWFSTPTATYGPSDIHGGAFTLLTETKVKYDGYGIAASVGAPGTTNAAGGHSLVLEAGSTYTLNHHFPDPLEVGAYQIIIQPNVFAQQFTGFHVNHATENKAPSESGTKVTELTGQQVNTVIAVEQDTATNGAYTLILAEAIMADVRGCEVIVNEVMLDINADVGSQFTCLPPLALYNPLGVQEAASAPFTRRSLPYRPGMFVSSTPGRSLTIPWWGLLHRYGVVGGPVMGDGLSITTGGSGYTAASGVATTGGNGSGLTVNTTVSTGAVSAVAIANAGVGYRLGDVLTIGGGSGGTVTVTRIASTGWRHLEWHKPDNYYEFCRASYGCVGAQLTLAGYPTSYLDIYSEYGNNRSTNPTCFALSFSSSSKTITVDNNDLFPSKPHYGEKLEYTKNGVRHTATYNNRTGTLDYATLGVSTIFQGVEGNADFWANLGISLTGCSYNNDPTITHSSSTEVVVGMHVSGDGIPAGAYVASVTDSTHFELSISTTGGSLSSKTLVLVPKDQVLKLTGPYDTYPSDSIYLDAESSIMVTTMGPNLKLASGSRDTNSLHLPDAYLCMWHPNLGRPFTWYSDDASRGFYGVTGAADTPIDQKPYNHVPEHFETIHYHDFSYVASKGPFALAMRWVVPPGGGTAPTNSPDGMVYTGNIIEADANFVAQGADVDDGSTIYNFNGYWPSGSRGGPGVSRLEVYNEALVGWGRSYGMAQSSTFTDSTGVAAAPLPDTSNDGFGYRFGLRQATNRPRWAPYIRGWLEVANSNALLGYYHGPLIQQDNKTNGWAYVGADGLADVSLTALYTGVLERITQVSSLMNQDQHGRKVRYSDGRRHTAPFGCPVRTLRNASTIRRLYPGDNAGQGIKELANAHRYYMVDWWGNNRGEDVRRFPVRGFGIRPSWDPEDAYLDTNVTHRPKDGAKGGGGNMFHGDYSDKYSGSNNYVSNTASGNVNGGVDWFNPASSLRVGDRGDGRGCRWPTVFNESLLMAVSETHDATGLVLSHSTAEPAFGQGLIRPSNLVLQDGEIERGISDRVDLNSDDGLLRSSASVGEGFETVTADSRGADPVSRDDFRLGLDVDTLAELNDGVSREYVVMSTEAASLHTDREVGQRTNIRGAYNVASRTLKDLDMTALSWAAQPVTGIVKHSNAHAMWALGGTYVIEWSAYAGILDDKGWGKASASSSSNPYQDSNHDPTIQTTNVTDSTIQFLYRPQQILDYKHSQMFRPYITLNGPQAGTNFYRATAGGKYGLFTSHVPSARTGTPSSPPYAPVYSLTPGSSVTVPDSMGPKIQGVDVTGYTKSDIRNPVARMVMSENTLEHFRSDANRTDGDGDGDYTVEPRFSQTLHPKGSDGDASYNTGDHSGE